MYKTLLTFLLVFLFVPFLNAEEKKLKCSDFAEDIDLSNNKTISLSGEYGSIQIFLEKTNNKKGFGRVNIKYYKRELGFPDITNFIITKNQDAVVVKKGNEYYLTAVKKVDKEEFKISFCDKVSFKYNNNKIKVENGRNTIYIKEGIFNKELSQVSIIENGKIVDVIPVK